MRSERTSELSLLNPLQKIVSVLTRERGEGGARCVGRAGIKKVKWGSACLTVCIAATRLFFRADCVWLTDKSAG